MQTAEETIRAAKEGFERRFAEKSFYNRQTRDAAHLQAILEFLPIRRGMRILDLGCGSGYLTFALARMHPAVSVTGLDIAEQTQKDNQAQAEAEHLDNLRFVSYDGTVFPFAECAFDLVVSRYSLHHFPVIEKSLAEISRVLTKSGCLFLSDPSPNAADTDGFLDAYMQVRKDGHIRFYRFGEWETLCRNAGFRLLRSFDSTIRFPRKTEAAYDSLIQAHPAIADSYDVELTPEHEIWISAPVNNLLFTKDISKTKAEQEESVW